MFAVARNRHEKRSKSCTQLDNPEKITAKHPMDYATASHRSRAYRTWAPGGTGTRKARHILLQQMQSLGQQALLTTPRDWTAKSVLHTLSCMTENRATGVDCWTPREMLRLPKRAVAGLAKVMYVVEESLALPNQICVNIVALRSKPNEGGTEKPQSSQALHHRRLAFHRPRSRAIWPVWHR